MADAPGFAAAQRAFSAHIRHPSRHAAPQDVDAARMRVYVDLFYRNVEGFLARAFRIARKVLPAAHWHALARDFYSRHRCASPHFYEVAQEFLDYLESEREASADPPFLHELCRFEWTRLALDLAAAEPPPATQPGTALADARFELSPVAWPLRFRFPVHRIDADFQPLEPPPQPTWLIAWRDREDEVRVMESNAATARLIARLEAGDALGEAAGAVAAQLGRSRETVLAYGETLALKLLDDGVLALASDVAER